MFVLIRKCSSAWWLFDCLIAYIFFKRQKPFAKRAFCLLFFGCPFIQTMDTQWVIGVLYNTPLSTCPTLRELVLIPIVTSFMSCSANDEDLVRQHGCFWFQKNTLVFRFVLSDEAQLPGILKNIYAIPFIYIIRNILKKYNTNLEILRLKGD